ncbi:cytohesin-3 [Lates japonicus]|uniref:Cytohesin-3 n=1 Tax=Lates japonicus TaxID=270547 RepID=A0AAD3MNT8_LATJO|nr:cytohesin-3 [Lates japonicus]
MQSRGRWGRGGRKEKKKEEMVDDFHTSVLQALGSCMSLVDLNLGPSATKFSEFACQVASEDRSMMEALAPRHHSANLSLPVNRNRGINEGGDLPEELLRKVGSKLGGRVKTWKRRWFILTDNCLYYFEYTTDKEPRGIIPLENLSIREVDEPRKPNCFELYNPNHKGQVIKACKTEADGRVVEGNHVVYRISAPTPEEKEEWIKSIKASISRDPFYDMLATRKRRIANKK